MNYYCCDCNQKMPQDWVLANFLEDEIIQGVVPCYSCYKRNEQLNKGKGED